MKKNEWRWAASVLTSGNLFFGFWAIAQVVEGNFLMACWLIVIASICDGLDGKLARLTKGASEIGIEFDSLADAVSFGAAPAALIYAVSFSKYGLLGLFLSAIPLLFGVFRLARFNKNATTHEKKGYDGLPIPMAAVTIATFIIFNYAVWGTFHLEVLLIPLTVVLSILMLSHIPYDVMPRFTLKETGKNLLGIFVIILGIVLVAINPPVIFFPLMLLYVLKGIVTAIFSHQEEEKLEEWDRILEK
jgi:CDP-diacylglycerol--serine O-phosphatidyltransferase